MTTRPVDHLDPLAAVLALLDAGDALAAAAAHGERRRLAGRASGPLPANGCAGMLTAWQAAAADADECLPLLADAIRPWMPAPPAAAPLQAAAPALDRAA